MLHKTLKIFLAPLKRTIRQKNVLVTLVGIPKVHMFEKITSVMNTTHFHVSTSVKSNHAVLTFLAFMKVVPRD
jgi:hypothetical protein